MKTTALVAALVPFGLLASCAGSQKAGESPSLGGPIITVLDEAGGAVPGAEVWIVDRLTLRADAAVVASRMTGDWVETSLKIAAEVRKADDAGVARFEFAPESGVLIAARRGALFGGVELGAIGDGDVEIRLRPRPGFRVRVVDADGQPAAGVPMSLAIPRGDRIERLAATAFTDADGRALIYEPPAAAFAGKRAGDRGTARVAVARVATHDLLKVPVDPVGTAEVVLPPTAAVELTASHPAFPADHWRGVIQLFVAKDGTRSEVTLAAPLVDSRVTVQHVEVGVDLRVVAVLAEKGDASRRLIGTCSQKLAPIEAGGEPSARFLQLDRGALFEGRLEDAEHEPVANTAIDVRIKDEPSTSWTIVTDDGGGFRWLLTESRGLLDGATLQIGGRRRAIETTIPKATPGQPISLGTIELR